MSELGALLADTVSRLFTDLVTVEVIEAAEHGRWPERLWASLEDGGLTMPLPPEAAGGAGGTWLDAHVVVKAAGRHAAPVPLPETIVAGWLLAQAGLPVPRGPLTLAPVHPGERLTLGRGADGWRLRGTATRVPWGAAAGHVVVIAEADSRPMIAAVAAAGARVTAGRNLALEPRDTLAFDDVPAVSVAPATAGVTAATVEQYGALVRAAQIAGALEGVLAQAVHYATERKQFGRPIGAFQAIQQSLAVLAGHTAAAGTAAEHAFAAAGGDHPLLAIAAAKIRAGEAAGVGAGIAHQVHGAIGFTYEHSLHFATRRLWAWRAEFGAESRWASELGRAVTGRGADALWAGLTAR